jgi:hypothetical protein
MSYLIAVFYISCKYVDRNFIKKKKSKHLDECRMTSYNLYRTINVTFFFVSQRNLSMKRKTCVSMKVEILFSSAFSLTSFLEIQVSFFDKPYVLYQKTNSTINSNSVQRRKEL